MASVSETGECVACLLCCCAGLRPLSALCARLARAVCSRCGGFPEGFGCGGTHTLAQCSHSVEIARRIKGSLFSACKKVSSLDGEMREMKGVRHERAESDAMLVIAHVYCVLFGVAEAGAGCRETEARQAAHGKG